MPFRYRYMKPRDVKKAVEYVASQPLERQRYGELLQHLPSVWLTLLRRDSLRAFVVEDLDTPKAGFCALMVEVFVADEFVQECKISPRFWLGPELVRRILRGKSPILTPREVRLANSNGGLHNALWVCHTPGGADERVNLINHVFMETFYQEHRGYQFKEISVHHLDLPNIKVALNAGACIWNFSSQRYEVNWKGSDNDIEKLLDRPCIIGVSRALAMQEWGRWTSTLFIWTPPRIGFTPGEQRLLLFALRGLTDKELSDELTVSSSTIKNTWRSIFDRVSRQLPALLPNALSKEEKHAGIRRGKEKRQRLLPYLREHPEELRPFLSNRNGKRHERSPSQDSLEASSQ